MVLNQWGIPYWWEKAELPSGECPVGQKNTASKFVTSHVNLFYKSQPIKTVLIAKAINIPVCGFVSHVWVKVTTLFFNLSKTDALVGIGLARGGKDPFFRLTAVINNNIDNQGHGLLQFKLCQPI